MEDKQLVEACKAQSSVAQKTLYESYLPYVLTIVRRFGVSDREIQDVVQEIFIEVFSNIKKFNSEKGELKYWIKSITIHKILNGFRKKKKGTIVELEVSIGDDLSIEINLDHIHAAYLLKMISQLPDGYREVFNLSVIEGYSHKEIGKLLNIAPASSRSQLSRAKEILRHQILQQRKQAKNYYG